MSLRTGWMNIREKRCPKRGKLGLITHQVENSLYDKCSVCDYMSVGRPIKKREPFIFR